jgi:hypothetical protein
VLPCWWLRVRWGDDCLAVECTCYGWHPSCLVGTTITLQSGRVSSSLFYLGVSQRQCLGRGSVATPHAMISRLPPDTAYTKRHSLLLWPTSWALATRSLLVGRHGGPCRYLHFPPLEIPPVRVLGFKRRPPRPIAVSRPWTMLGWGWCQCGPIVGHGLAFVRSLAGKWPLPWWGWRRCSPYWIALSSTGAVGAWARYGAWLEASSCNNPKIQPKVWNLNLLTPPLFLSLPKLHPLGHLIICIHFDC